MNIESLQAIALSEFDCFFQIRIMLADHFIRVRELSNISIDANYNSCFSNLTIQTI